MSVFIGELEENLDRWFWLMSERGCQCQVHLLISCFLIWGIWKINIFLCRINNQLVILRQEERMKLWRLSYIAR